MLSFRTLARYQLITDLVIAGVRVVPGRDDWFEETLPGPEGVQTFVVAPFNNEPEYRYSDPQRTVFRVHCKRATLAD